VVPSGDSVPTWSEDLTKSIRAEIEAFFAGPENAQRHRGSRENYGRLIADLEQKILASLREEETPPPRLGPFVLEERIGRGGFAVVYRATHARTGVRAAVKVVPASDPASHARVMSEVESLARLRHPNVVRVIDTGDEGGFAWIATEFVPGQTLADWIRQSRGEPDTFQIADAAATRGGVPAHAAPRDAATVRTAITWFRDLAAALDALHAIGLVHHDVKPANILIDHDRRPFLIDFGLSSSSESTVDGMLAGTVPYMSPEQTLGGYVAVTPRSDVYSLAATFHEVLTGERVTRGARRDEMLHQIAFVPVAPPSRVSPYVPRALDPIFAKALAKDSNARYETARDLAEDLDRWLAQRPLIHANEGVWRRATRGVRSRPAVAALVAVALVAALAWAAVAIVTSERDYARTREHVKSALDAGDAPGALATLQAATPRFGHRDAFRQQYREAVAAGGRILARRLLGSQAFAATGLAGDAGHARLARDAAAHVAASGFAEPNLVLVMALSRHLSGRSDEAAAVLAEHRAAAEQSRALTELAAILAITRGDREGHDAALRRLGAMPRDADPAPEVCLRVWRHLLAARTKGFPAPLTAERESMEAEVRAILENESDHGLARALLGTLKLERKDWYGARFEFDELLKRPGDVSDRAGSLLMHAASGMLAAGAAAPQEKESLIRTATSFAKDAISSDPRLLDRFSHEIIDAAWDVRAGWIKAALDGPWRARPQFGPRFLVFAANTICVPPPGQGPGALSELAEAVDREYAAKITPETTADYRGIKTFQVWDLRDQAEAALKAGKNDEAARLATKARACIREARERLPDLPYVLIAGDALTAAFLADVEADPEIRSRLRSEAAGLLRAAVDPDLLKLVTGRAPDRATADQIRAMSEACAERLELLETEEGASTRGF
jgi:hypothetical protein